MTVYLDYNATTPVDPRIAEAVRPYLEQHFGNPSSGHALGQIGAEAVGKSRRQVAALLGCQPHEVVFTSGGTESNNHALKGLFLATPPAGGHFVTSSLEHPAIVVPARYLERWGVEVTIVPCDRRGVVDPDDVEAALRPDTRLVSIMHANNEIGTLQPVAEIARRCRARGVPVHTDAAQSVAKVPVRVDELGVDLLSLAGHKIYAPKGVGALYIRDGLQLEPLLHGAGHEQGRRAGTENVPYLVALGLAAELGQLHLADAGGRLASLRDRLEERLRAGITAELTVHGAAAERLPNTLSVNLPGVSGAELLAEIPALCASTGSACHSGTTALSPTLAAIGLSPEEGRGTVRLSVGRFTTEAEVDQAAEWLAHAWRRRVACGSSGV